MISKNAERRGKALCLAAGLIFGSAGPLLAGDPCPISFDLRYVGAPDWVDLDAVFDGLQSRQSWWGISWEPVSDGRLLTEVVPDGPTDRAGLRQGDIILQIGDAPALSDVIERAETGDLVSGTARRGTAEFPFTITVGRTDPVLFAIRSDDSDGACTIVRRSFAAADERREVLARVLNSDRSFRCDDAHLALAGLGDGDESTVYFLRGSHRILISLPDWGTACTESASLDGEAMTDEAVMDFFLQAVGRFIEDRFANP